jgi:CII-binding regulator of phage lambda lysogenization HflD
LFGTATISDIHQLHITLDEQQSKDADMVHSLSNQVTYVRKLDHVARVNSDAIANLLTIFKDVILQSNDKFQQVTRDILSLNITVHAQSELYMIDN